MAKQLADRKKKFKEDRLLKERAVEEKKKKLEVHVHCVVK